MSQRRCPNCGGLVGIDADWCTQCFARLDDGPQAPPGQPTQETPPADEPTPGSSAGQTSGSRPAAPAVAEGGGVVRSKGDAIVWDCPACGTENPLDSPACSACGTPFGSMLQQPAEHLEVDPGRAAMASLFFPGAGHFLAGHRGEGFARGIIFLFAFILGLASLGAVRSGSKGPYLLLMLVSLAAAAVLYVTSTADAGRAARGDQPLLSMRMLLYGGIGLIFVAILLLTIALTQARG